MTEPTAIAARALGKRYGTVRAVDSLDITVRQGEVYGLIGLNGAGKTTTIRMLLGLIRPTSGEVELFGRKVRAKDARALTRVGYLVESASAYPNLTVRENLDIQRRLTSAPGPAVDEAIQLLRLGAYTGRKAGVLSLGNKQRLALARALLHRPALLILDEPANALDPAGIVEIRDLLRDLSSTHGVTVFVSSHILTEVAHVADRIAIVHQGRLLEELTRADLQAKARAYLEVEAPDARQAQRVIAQAGFRDAAVFGGTVRVAAASDCAPAIAAALLSAAVPFTGIAPRQEDLEAYFLERIGAGA